MKANKSTKSFDAVEMMRAIRSKITEETQNMSFQELQQYIKQRFESADVRSNALPR
ncbi:hypothetical protein SAMN00120144_2520 [Hymenobacter roseosalivarius DSM 11622]|uniref:Uncharacterized protein n=1 Tax=Hymenobacter roseosalivarius DSM 11622 TaxID=645990 RepID=A0A1W1W4V4_9BACT|nr:hypothetical protein [Hymenobacter roseosalivarius]SMC00104.1 hypothetical protein SAMN00120144_2520 [Hymenobacter roseosalivarius DSM 11622]